MKKFFAFFLVIGILFLTSPVYAMQELYKLKNARRSNVSSVVYQALVSKKYNVIKQDPFLANKSGENTVVILQQNGDDLYIYFDSEKSFKALKKNIIQYYDYEEITDINYLQTFKNSAQRVVTGEVKTYTFDNANYTAPKQNVNPIVFPQGQNQYPSAQNPILPAQNVQNLPENVQVKNIYPQPVAQNPQPMQNSQPVAQNPQQSAQNQGNLSPVILANEIKTPSAPKNTMQGYIGKVGRGEHLQAYLQNPINTASAQTGDTVIAILSEDWTVPNGVVIAEKGSVFEGRLTEAKPAAAGMRNARVSLEFNKLISTDGNVYPISTKSVDFVVDNDGRFMKMTKKIAVGSLVGGLLGAATGGIAAMFSGDADAIWKGAIIGAGISGVTSGISAVAERGVDVEIPAYTEIEIEPDKDIDIILNY